MKDSTSKMLRSLALAAGLLLAPGVAWARPNPAPSAIRGASTTRTLTDSELFA